MKREKLLDNWSLVIRECRQERHFHGEKNRRNLVSILPSSSIKHWKISKRQMFDINSASEPERKISRPSSHDFITSTGRKVSLMLFSLSRSRCRVLFRICVSGITKIEMWIYFSYWLLMTRDNNKNTAYTLSLDAYTHTRTRNMPFSYSPPAARLMLFFIKPIKSRATRCLCDDEKPSSLTKERTIGSKEQTHTRAHTQN